MRLSLPTSVVMAAAPALLMGVVAVTARLEQAEFPTPEYGPMMHEHILAYVPLVRQADLLTASSARQRASHVETQLTAWIEGYETGKLRPVLPAASDDLGESGARYAMARSRGQILHVASVEAKRMARAGEFGRAARLTSLALNLARLQRYASDRTAVESATAQRGLIAGALLVAPFLASGQRMELAGAVLSSAPTAREYRDDWTRSETLVNGMRASQPPRFKKLAKFAATSGRNSKLPDSIEVGSREHLTIRVIQSDAEIAELVRTAYPEVLGPLKGPPARPWPATTSR